MMIHVALKSQAFGCHTGRPGPNSRFVGNPEVIAPPKSVKGARDSKPRPLARQADVIILKTSLSWRALRFSPAAAGKLYSDPEVHFADITADFLDALPVNFQFEDNSPKNLRNSDEQDL
jgi:hypothetical protein